MSIGKIIDGSDIAVGTIKAMAPNPVDVTITTPTGASYRAAVATEAAIKIKEVLKAETPERARNILNQVQKKLREPDLPPFNPSDFVGPRIWDDEYSETGLRMALFILNELQAKWHKGSPLRIERCRDTLNHALSQAFIDNRILLWRQRGQVARAGYSAPMTKIPRIGHVFMVEHDWAAAFAGATGLDGEWRLPYDDCCFEFCVSGYRVCLLACQLTEQSAPRRDRGDTIIDGLIEAMMFVQVKQGWLHAPAAGDLFAPLAQFLVAQMRAICISLSAKVAETEVVRVPFKFNQARERRGKPALADHHIVRLAHRHRVARAPDGMRANDERRRSPRLHFRHGHDRHYPNYKVWIHWQLIGDPDLGFIDKDYRL